MRAQSMVLQVVLHIEWILVQSPYAQKQTLSSLHIKQFMLQGIHHPPPKLCCAKNSRCAYSAESMHQGLLLSTLRVNIYQDVEGLQWSSMFFSALLNDTHAMPRRMFSVFCLVEKRRSLHDHSPQQYLGKHTCAQQVAPQFASQPTWI